MRRPHNAAVFPFGKALPRFPTRYPCLRRLRQQHRERGTCRQKHSTVPSLLIGVRQFGSVFNPPHERLDPPVPSIRDVDTIRPVGPDAGRFLELAVTCT